MGTPTPAWEPLSYGNTPDFVFCGLKPYYGVVTSVTDYMDPSQTLRQSGVATLLHINKLAVYLYLVHLLMSPSRRALVYNVDNSSVRLWILFDTPLFLLLFGQK